MFSRARSAAIAAAVAMLVLSACGGGGPRASADQVPEGDPVAGGVAHVIEAGEPRSLDPALLQSVWARMGTVGNALYGALLVDDKQTAGFKLKMLEQFDSADGGKTFTVKVKQGMVFSDGSPFTAEAIKFGWDRMRDPATGSPYIGQASLVDHIDVVDDRTATVTLTNPTPHFPSVLTTTAMNWIGKPEVLRQGREAVDATPIGAGPFVLDRWDRGSVVALKKNERFWDAPRPYLDRLEIRAVGDAGQRLNAVRSGQADLAVEATDENVVAAREYGLATMDLPLDGGQVFILNSRKAPFDDVRARNAVSSALDLDALNLAAQGGYAQVPRTFFRDGSPFYSDVPIHTHDPGKAQALFDELAGEGKPVAFSFSYFPTNLRMFEAIQAQFSQYRNVTLTADPRDLSELGSIAQKGAFQMTANGIVFGAEPDPQVWTYLHGDSAIGNFAHVDDPELNAALDAGRRDTDPAARVAAYRKVQEKLAELTPYIFHSRSGSGLIRNDTIHGVTWYGLGILLPETLWVRS